MKWVLAKQATRWCTEHVLSHTALRIMTLVVSFVMPVTMVDAANASSLVLETQSAKGRYQATLAFDQKPNTRGFQICKLLLRVTSGELPPSLKISIDGGMPAHGHGLPTAPVVRPGDTKGEYLLEGLKFSMPGNWLLRFRIDNAQSVDIATFVLNVELY